MKLTCGRLTRLQEFWSEVSSMVEGRQGGNILMVMTRFKEGSADEVFQPHSLPTNCFVCPTADCRLCPARIFQSLPRPWIIYAFLFQWR